MIDRLFSVFTAVIAFVVILVVVVAMCFSLFFAIKDSRYTQKAERCKTHYSANQEKLSKCLDYLLDERDK